MNNVDCHGEIARPFIIGKAKFSSFLSFWSCEAVVTLTTGVVEGRCGEDVDDCGDRDVAPGVVA